MNTYRIEVDPLEFHAESEQHALEQWLDALTIIGGNDVADQAQQAFASGYIEITDTGPSPA